MSNGDPWGGNTPNAGAGMSPMQAWQASQGSQSPLMDANVGQGTGLDASQNRGHSWNLTDLWGGDNKYADWSMSPASFAPQGDSASFYDALAQQYAGRNAGNIAGAYTGANQAWNQYQGNAGQTQGMLSMLQGAAQGNAPSAAQIQMNQGIQQSIAAQQALANSARGGPGAWASAQRGAAGQMASTQQSAIQQGAALRAQEMAQNRGMYANALNQFGNQSLQAQQQMGQYGQAFEKQNDASMLGLLGYGQTAGQIANAQENAWNNIVSGATANNAGNANSATASTAQAVGTAVAAMSDARAKALVQSEASHPKGAYEMLDKLNPVSFNYKPGVGEDTNKRRYGVMAQDLQKSPMGASIVNETPRGKTIDVTHAMGAALAASADLHARVKRLEHRK